MIGISSSKINNKIIEKLCKDLEKIIIEFVECMSIILIW